MEPAFEARPGSRPALCQAAIASGLPLTLVCWGEEGGLPAARNLIPAPAFNVRTETENYEVLCGMQR